MFKRLFLASILVAVLVMFTGSMYAQSKQVYQEVFDTDNLSYPDNDPDGDGAITFEAWIEGTFLAGGIEYNRRDYILRETSPGSQVSMMFGSFFILVNAGNFNTATPEGFPVPPVWQAGETLHILVKREATEHIAYTNFRLTTGSTGQFRQRTEAVDNSVSLRLPPYTLFDSNRQNEDGEFLHPVATNATLLDGFDPDEDGVYRANDWGQAGRYWQVQFSTIGATDLSLTSQIGRQYAGGAGPHPRGPRFYTTLYSTDGQEWTPVGNPLFDDFDEIYYWELPNNQNLTTMSFNLPEECEDQELVRVRWLHLEEWAGFNQNGWGDIRNVVVKGDQYYTLRVSIDGNGSTNFEPDSTYSIYAGSPVTLSAIEDTEGWIFDRWVVNNTEFDTINVHFSITTNIQATAHFIQFPSPNPFVARFPSPVNDSVGVSVDIEEVSWSYVETYGYVNPAGFRVYFNTTGEFDEDDDFEWVSYVEEQVRYLSTEVIPDEIEYAATYYWKVIPTTIEPDGRSDTGDSARNRRRNNSDSRSQLIIRGDAINCPVWSFTTQRMPNPTVASNPNPAHNATGVSAHLERVGWQYTVNPLHTNPIGFRVYGGTSPEFDEEEYGWVPYVQNQTEYSLVIEEGLDYATKYYWQVVPTTVDPEDDRRSSNRSRIARLNDIRSDRKFRGDAEDCPIWVFTTEMHPYPAFAVNPVPADDAENVNLNIQHLQWDYVVDTLYTNPVGFKVFMNDDGEFDEEDSYEWVYYVAEQVTYRLNLSQALDLETSYYWKVVPSTTDPAEDRSTNHSRRLLTDNRSSRSAASRYDTPDCPVWSFTTTATVSIDDDVPFVTMLHGNFPNPFNPQTTIRFSLAETANVSLEVFNSKGQRVTTLLADQQHPGNHSIVWDGKDQHHNRVGSGIYFYRLLIDTATGNSYQKTMKMMLLK